MAFKIIEEHDPLPERDPLIVIYGEPGSGKTSLVQTADNPLTLDFDKGINRAVGRKRTVDFDNWDEVIDFMKPGGYLETHKPGTLVIDTGGAMLDEFMGEFVVRRTPREGKPGGGLNLQGYGSLKELFAAFLRRCKQLGVLPVFVCHAVEKGDAEERRLRPKLTGGAYDILVGKADLVGYLEMKGEKRTLSFNPTQRTVGKNCVEFAPMEIPHYESDAYPSFFQRVIDATRKRMAAMTEAQRQALEQVKAVQERLAACTDFPALQDVLSEMEQLPAVYQLQTRPGYIDRYAAIWNEKNLDGAETLADFNRLVGMANQLDQPLQVVKRAINTAAVAKGFVFDKLGTRLYIVAPVPAAQPEASVDTQAPAPTPPPLTAGASATTLDQHLAREQGQGRRSQPAKAA